MSEMSESTLTTDDEMSDESYEVLEILEMVLEDEYLFYRCRTDGGEEVVDRSDLIDGSARQRMLRQFERANPPPWDDECTHCEGVGCEECICDECGRKCRHIKGLNYGCELHPVV